MKDQSTISQQIQGLISLSRWSEHVVFVVPLTILGALLAVRMNDHATLDWRLFLVLGANLIGVTCGFMINDIEDAPDDAQDPERIHRNPIASGQVSARLGYTVYWMLVAMALLLYIFTDMTLLVISLIMFLLSHSYSWRPVRLKALPIVDIVSHSLLLGGFITLAGYLAYDKNPGSAWWIIASTAFGSVYGQFYNQLRDYDSDKEAGLHNTSIVLGKKRAKQVMYASIILALVCFVIAVLVQLFPVGLGIAALLGIAITAKILRPTVDARGDKAIDSSGAMQIQFLVAVNFTIAVWFIWALIAY